MSDLSVPSERKLILVVEDEPAVRAVAVEFLEHEGFEVIEAPTADYAITILQAKDDIGVVFTDVTTPGHLNGFDLAQIAQTLHPNISVIVTSGALPSGFSGVATDARFVKKPYQMTAVIRLIHELTDGSSHS
ncbi:response regulator [Microvirga aerilata]|uniref:Response regulator n=1 Tax=Microvirga aerilata TaxID=670292 RepID=A0A936ZB18_9HYPH|nr:response regulator [Microvirga aerilata]MBL0406421.1 response regulator [Microvirga aerilata]